MNILFNLVDRLREPSSWAGFALLLSIFAPALEIEAINTIVNAAAAVCAALSIFLREKSNP